MLIWMMALISVCMAGPAKLAPRAKAPVPDWSYVETRLYRAGFKKDFVKALKQTYVRDRFMEVVELNLLLYLRKSDYHGVQVTDNAVRNIKKFMTTNRTVLQSAEKEHGVAGNVVASLLWMESRHGQNKGDFHVPSAYLHLIQGERPAVVKYLQDHAYKYASNKVTEKTRQEIRKRTRKKAEWAIAELKAVQKMYARNHSVLRTLRGSFAGAFGMPQFIPSSYVHWARPYKKGGVADLTIAHDAIFSVANYLRDSGWRKAKPKSHVKALLRYNNHEDYANAILEMARRVQAPSASPIRRVSTVDIPK